MSCSTCGICRIPVWHMHVCLYLHVSSQPASQIAEKLVLDLLMFPFSCTLYSLCGKSVPHMAFIPTFVNVCSCCNSFVRKKHCYEICCMVCQVKGDVLKLGTVIAQLKNVEILTTNFSFYTNWAGSS